MSFGRLPVVIHRFAEIEESTMSDISPTSEEFGPAHMLLNPLAQSKGGDDPIFYWFTKCLAAKKSGRDVVNGTLGSLLDEAGKLAIIHTVEKQIRNQPSVELSGYAPLRGLPSFRELAIELALGSNRSTIEQAGLSIISIATPGGCGALSATAANFIDGGDKVLLRSRHWGPYKTIIEERDCKIATWPLLPETPEAGLNHLDRGGFANALTELVQAQNRVLIWLNDPAHNPTGLSLQASERRAVLEEALEHALAFPNIGITLLIDSAYSLYAAEPYGWASTLREEVERRGDFPNNLMLCFAVSCSKSHTSYGLRTGALVCIHPDSDFITKLEDVLLHTGRGTWSAAPRVAQRAISEIHLDSELHASWRRERDAFKRLLDERRDALRRAAAAHNLILNPTHDGYFAFLECRRNQEVCEIAAQNHDVFLVPLNGGVRIGVCAIPAEQMERVAAALADALAQTR